MLVHAIQQRTAFDGSRVVEALVHLTPEQSGAGADAVRAVTASRYRVPGLSVDEIVTMRELTALGDGLDDLRGVQGVSVVVLTIARLGLLLDAIGESPAGPAHRLLDGLAEVHAEALRTALDGPPADVAVT